MIYSGNNQIDLCWVDAIFVLLYIWNLVGQLNFAVFGLVIESNWIYLS